MRFELIEINDIHEEKYDGPIYDLEINKDHSYNVNGTIVHNSGCLTSDVTGIGYPQLSAVIDCADAAHGLGGHIISDGGCKKFGDIIKAFAGGADFVMLGGILAGHDEGLKEEDVIEQVLEGDQVRRFVKFYGMSSKFANEKYNGGMKDYRASEGKEILIPCKGPVDETLLEMMGAMRSACTYLGAKRLKEIPRRATFIKRFR